MATISIKKRKLIKANKKVREGKLVEAIQYYLDTLENHSDTTFKQNILNNLAFAQNKYHRQRKKQSLSVAVCGWELSHNAAGRVYTLAQIYQKFADVEIIGSLFLDYGKDIWEPIRTTNIPKHTFIVKEHSVFLRQAFSLVKKYPYDIVHLSKPRMPNIFFGILYKLIWGAKVIVDIDDEELAFVDAQTPLFLDGLLSPLRDLEQLDGRFWTRLAVGLVNHFDGITVSNIALKKRYGGMIIRHARDEEFFICSSQLREKSREKYSISKEMKVVIFCGTPREHKGLLKIAKAISNLENNNVIFVIVGDFNPGERFVKTQLLIIDHVRYLFIPSQPFCKLPEILAMADFSIFPQDANALVSQYQVPAKLSDALAMEIFVLATATPSLTDLLDSGAVIALEESDWHRQFSQVLMYSENKIKKQVQLARKVFLDKLSLKVNSQCLRTHIEKCANSELSNKLKKIRLCQLSLFY